MNGAAAPGPPRTPPWTCRLDLADGGATEIEWTALPARPGVCAIEDADGGTLSLVTGADLRRLVRTRLAPPAEDAAPSRRADVRGLARRVLGLTVGSPFEADWLYLRLAATRLPLAHAALVDRYRACFVHVDPEAPFPEFTRGETPGSGPGLWLGPLPDKRGAARYIEIIQDAFDLCRYHELLVQAPDAQACAYKEMGRCPAPCDGTVSLEHYRRQVRDAIAFATSDADRYRRDLEARMAAASAAQDYESARLAQVLLERTEPARRGRFAIVDRLERFRFLAIQRSERPGLARCFLIDGGVIEPVADLRGDLADRDRLRAAAASVLETVAARPAAGPATDETTIAAIGLVCEHLFAKPKRRSPGSFLRIDERLDARRVLDAVDRLHGAEEAPFSDRA